MAQRRTATVWDKPAYAAPTAEVLLSLVTPWQARGGGLTQAREVSYQDWMQGSARAPSTAGATWVRELRLPPALLLNPDAPLLMAAWGQKRAAGLASWEQLQGPETREEAERIIRQQAQRFTARKRDIAARLRQGENVDALTAELRKLGHQEQSDTREALEKRFGKGFRYLATVPTDSRWDVDARGLLEALFRYATEVQGMPPTATVANLVLDVVKRVRVEPYRLAAKRLAEQGGPTFTGAQLMALHQRLNSRRATALPWKHCKGSPEDLAQRKALYREERRKFLAEEVPEALRVSPEHQERLIKELVKVSLELGQVPDWNKDKRREQERHGKIGVANNRGRLTAAELGKIIAAYAETFCVAAPCFQSKRLLQRNAVPGKRNRCQEV